MKKIKIKYTCLLWVCMAAVAFSCNSNAKERKGFVGFLEGTEKVDIEKLHNNLATEFEDSTATIEYLNKADLPKSMQESFLNFYKSRNYEPAWVNDRGITDEAEELYEAIEASPEHGLSQEDYKLQYLYHLKKKLEQEDASLQDYQKLDKELTAAYLKLASHILRGRMNPEHYDAVWKTSRRQINFAAHLQQALEEEEVKESLSALEPEYKGYQRLKDALQQYRKLVEEHPEWRKLPEDLVLKPGDSSEYVNHLAEMLYILGDAGEPDKEIQVYDEELAGRLAAFQKRNGLVSDSIVATNTLKMLNVPLKDRIEQIKLNLERFRWLPERPEGRHVVVNIPEYRLYVYEGKDSTFSSRVIVGKAFESTTPVFNDSIEYITFSPTWTVPVSIATEEMLPALRKDRNYLIDRNFKLYENWQEDARELDSRSINWNKVKAEEFPYRIVQQPGPNNSLGKVKFMFPNAMKIYLHDTPADYLFDRNERDFSHGCIRVEKPVEFAEYLLNDMGWNESSIISYMNRSEPENTVLEEKVPVFIEYRTAWVDSEGQLNFREDIYGHDRKQLGKLEDVIAENPDDEDDE